MKTKYIYFYHLNHARTIYLVDERTVKVPERSKSWTVLSKEILKKESITAVGYMTIERYKEIPYRDIHMGDPEILHTIRKAYLRTL